MLKNVKAALLVLVLVACVPNISGAAMELFERPAQQDTEADEVALLTSGLSITEDEGLVDELMLLTDKKFDKVSDPVSKELKEGLFEASDIGDLSAVFECIEKGVYVDCETEAGATALMLAAQKGYELIVGYLLKVGADINHETQCGLTALMLAAQNGHETVVRFLIKAGAEVNHEKQDGWTALMSAAQNGHETIVRFLIENGADVDHEYQNGWTALMSAAQQGHVLVAELLVESGADVNHKKQNGWTALMSAAQQGHEAIVKLLVENGADVSHETQNGRTENLILEDNLNLRRNTRPCLRCVIS